MSRDSKTPSRNSASGPIGSPDPRWRGLSPFGREIAARWDRTNRLGESLRRWIVTALVVTGVIGAVVGVALTVKLHRAYGVSYCRGNLRYLARGLTAYTADYDERFPPSGCDASAVLSPYVTGQRRVCPLLRDTQYVSYTIAPELGGRPIADVTGSYDTTIALVETGFRHYYRGSPMMAVAHLDGSGGAATLETLRLPHEGVRASPTRGGPASVPDGTPGVAPPGMSAGDGGPTEATSGPAAARR